jgi:DNA polymerase III subunit epsilon
MSKLCFIDTETTGTDPTKNGLIQLAGLIEVDGEEKQSFNFHIQPFPNDVVEESALAVNKTSQEILKSFQVAGEAYSDFVKILSLYVDKYDKKDKFFFVGYNARFDADFVRSFFEKNNDKYFGSWFWFPPIDVMNLAIVRLINRRAELPNFKLGSIAVELALHPEGDLHDALTDIRLTKQMFYSLTKTGV